MYQTCNFDENKDIMEVRCGLAIDIANAIETGTVLDSGSAPNFNDIDDVSSIRGRMSDVFEVLDAQKSALAAVDNERSSKLAKESAPTSAPASGPSVVTSPDEV